MKTQFQVRKKERALQEAENNGSKVLFLTFWGKCLVFLCEGNYAYVDNGNIIIPPEHIVCCSERHV